MPESSALFHTIELAETRSRALHRFTGTGDYEHEMFLIPNDNMCISFHESHRFKRCLTATRPRNRTRSIFVNGDVAVSGTQVVMAAMII